jgi:hypothetical protein
VPRFPVTVLIKPQHTAPTILARCYLTMQRMRVRPDLVEQCLAELRSAKGRDEMLAVAGKWFHLCVGYRSAVVRATHPPLDSSGEAGRS